MKKLKSFVGWSLLACLLGSMAVLVYGDLHEAEGPWVEIPWVSQSTRPAPPAIRPTPREAVTPASSTTTARLFYASFVAMLGSALGSMVFHQRRARRLRVVDPTTPLRDGDARVFGEVELVHGELDPPIRVDIHEAGRLEAGRLIWKETGREVRVRPFYIKRGNGTRVRVEPDSGVELALPGERNPAPSSHDAVGVRHVELRPGAQVHVWGELCGGNAKERDTPYRDDGPTAVMRTPARGRLLVSKEGPSEAASARARFYRFWAIALTITFAIGALLLMPAYEILTVDGKVLVAPVHAKRTWETPSRTGRYGRVPAVRHYEVRALATLDDGSTLEVHSECSEELFACVSAGTCDAAPFLVAKHLPGTYQIGESPRVAFASQAALVALTALAFMAYLFSAVVSRRDRVAH